MVAENKNLVVVWVAGGGSLPAGIFPGRGIRKFLGSRGTPPAKKTLSIVVLLRSWCLQHSRIYINAHLKTGKQRYDSNQETKQLSWLKIQQNTFFEILGLMIPNTFLKLIRTIFFTICLTLIRTIFFDHLSYILLGVGWLWLKIE